MKKTSVFPMGCVVVAGSGRARASACMRRRAGWSLLLAILLGGCATPPPPDVGAVVLAAQVQLPPVPVIVLRTLPKQAGYFQCRLLSYLQQPCESPTPSTPLMPAAGPMPFP